MNTALDLILQAADRTPDREAIVDDLMSRHLTYRELQVEIDSVAAGMLAFGIRPGQTVATALPNIFEHCVALLAIQRLGAVAVPINPRLPASQIAYCVKLVRACAIIMLDDDELAEQLPGYVLTLRVGKSASANFHECQGDIARLPCIPRPKPNDPAFILFTSGTTGKPKAVVLPHRASEPRVTWILQSFGVRPAPFLKVLGAAPMFHAIGLQGVFLTTLALGGTYYTLAAFHPATAREIVRHQGINLLFMPPVMFHGLVREADYGPGAFKSVQYVIYGGSPMESALFEQLEKEWPSKIMHGYGSTELMCPLFQTDPGGRLRNFQAALGWQIRAIVPGGQASDVVPIGCVGELIFDTRNDSMFSGYFDNSAANAEKLKDGWYYSGDLAVRTLEGYNVVGRVDDMIRTGSETVYPEELETLLAQHEGIAEACVVGLPHQRWGQQVTAVVVARSEITGESLRRWLADRKDLAPHKRPKAFLIIDGPLPRSPLSKLDRAAIKSLALSIVTSSREHAA